MRIAVLGAGAVGGALASRWSANGHETVVGVRDLSSPRAKAVAELVGTERVVSVDEAAGSAEVVLMAIPGEAVASLVERIAADLDGRIVIDASNNVQAPIRNSLAVISRLAPDVRLFRAFNSLPAATLANPDIDGRPADLFFCGADAGDRSAVELLIRDAGLHPIYVGDLEWAPVVDALGGLSFALGRSLPGRRLAFNLVTA